MTETKQLSVLVVEDDSLLREIIRRMLVGVYKVLEATNGEEAIQKAVEHQPNLILLDLILPTMSGFEILGKLKADEKTAAIPVFILSNFGQREDIEKGKQLGAEKYLIKAHMSPLQIMEEVKSFLDHL